MYNWRTVQIYRGERWCRRKGYNSPENLEWVWGEIQFYTVSDNPNPYSLLPQIFLKSGTRRHCTGVFYSPYWTSHQGCVPRYRLVRLWILNITQVTIGASWQFYFQNASLCTAISSLENCLHVTETNFRKWKQTALTCKLIHSLNELVSEANQYNGSWSEYKYLLIAYGFVLKKFYEIACGELTGIPQTHVGYEMIDSQRALGPELVIIISHPAAASGIIVLLKTSQNIEKRNIIKIRMPMKILEWKYIYPMIQVLLRVYYYHLFVSISTLHQFVLSLVHNKLMYLYVNRKAFCCECVTIQLKESKAME